jgi:hypothetical protein
MLPRLPVSAVATVTLVTDVSMTTVTKVTTVCRCYGYLGYWRQHGCTVSKVAIVCRCYGYLPYWRHRDCTVTKVISVSVVAEITCYHGYKSYPVRTCHVCSQSVRPDRWLRTVTVLKDTVCNKQRHNVALTAPLHHMVLLQVHVVHTKHKGYM